MFKRYGERPFASPAVLVPVAISLAWYFVPAVAQGVSGDGWQGWGYVFAASWFSSLFRSACWRCSFPCVFVGNLRVNSQNLYKAIERAKYLYLLIDLVPEVGVEPTLPEGNGI
jgi:hypothetical protein